MWIDGEIFLLCITHDFFYAWIVIFQMPLCERLLQIVYHSGDVIFIQTQDNFPEYGTIFSPSGCCASLLVMQCIFQVA